MRKSLTNGENPNFRGKGDLWIFKCVFKLTLLCGNCQTWEEYLKKGNIFQKHVSCKECYLNFQKYTK